MIGKMLNKDLLAPIYITILSLIAVVYGFTIVPSPQAERNMTLDHKRVVDLGNLQASIDTYYQNNNTLPSSLNILKPDDPGTKLYMIDPETKQPYGYKVTNPVAYKLCTTFLTNSSKEETNIYDENNPDYSTYKDNFKHPAGYYCFNENETGDSNTSGSPEPTYYSAGSTTPTPAPGNKPAAILSSLDKTGTCQWTPKFTLKGFAPYSTITVNSYGTLSDACNANKTHSYSWTAQWTQQTDQNGNITISYTQNDYGDYTYSFSDDSGDDAMVHYQNGPATGPTIVPAGGGGGAGPQNSNSGSGL